MVAAIVKPDVGAVFMQTGGEASQGVLLMAALSRGQSETTRVAAERARSKGLLSSERNERISDMISPENGRNMCPIGNVSPKDVRPKPDG